MTYVFDTNTLTAIFRHYYYDRFPSFWEKFNSLKHEKRTISVREVKREIETLKRDDALEKWIKENTEFFEDPSVNELKFVTEIYKVKHFQQNLGKKQLLHGGAFADPFIIAKAKMIPGIVVTQEKKKKTALKYPIFVNTSIFSA